MILSAGLSPAWQQILQFDSFNVGEVNRAKTAHWCASGKVLNVAIAAKHLSHQTSLLSAIGGASGAAIAQEVQSNDIFADWITLPESTRTCTTILEDQHDTTELVENAGPVSPQVLEEFYDKFRIHAEVADITVLTGSMPAGTPDSYYSALIRDVPRRFILDIRGEGLRHALAMSPFLVKPNREELAATVQSSLENEDEVIDAMQSLNRQGAEWVVVSSGPDKVLVTNRGDVYQLTPPTVEVVNPIGCGDCLAAGIAVKLAEDAEVIEAIRFGIGAAALNATMLLPARVTRAESARYADEVVVEG